MKVEHPRTNPSVATDPVGPETARSASRPARTAGADRVCLSADLRLVSAALQEAKTTEPAIRPDAVARGRALLASGELGLDLEALAERIMDTLADSHEDNPS
jgi:hypothetical protein